jgi:hypothetical protein
MKKELRIKCKGRTSNDRRKMSHRPQSFRLNEESAEAKLDRKRNVPKLEGPTTFYLKSNQRLFQN